MHYYTAQYSFDCFQCFMEKPEALYIIVIQRSLYYTVRTIGAYSVEKSHFPDSAENCCLTHLKKLQMKFYTTYFPILCAFCVKNFQYFSNFTCETGRLFTFSGLAGLWRLTTGLFCTIASPIKSFMYSTLDGNDFNSLMVPNPEWKI
jgi:hypothetical protein